MNPNVTWIELTCLVWLLVLAATMFVPLRARRIAWTLLQRLVQIAGLAALIAAGVYLIWPAAAPECFRSGLAPLSDYLERWLGEPYRPLSWLVATTAIALIAAPLSIAIGFVRRLDTLGTLLRRVAGGTWRAADNSGGGVVPAMGRVGVGRDEFDEALGAVATATSGRSGAPRRRKLSEILDQ
jgi:hypothetical protein